MSAGYVAVQWNRHKLVYDALLGAFVALYLLCFVLVTSFSPAADTSPPILVIRALGSLAFTLLTIILCIGPAARLLPTLAPVLYNRRHLGVVTALIALAHFALALVWYHGFGVISPIVSLLVSGGDYTSLARFPFQVLGLPPLLILIVMAATSHDFWLANLGARVWKWIHMLIYPAYALLVMHIALGYLRTGEHTVEAVLLVLSIAMVSTLHVAAGFRERLAPADVREAWADAGDPRDIPDRRARIIQLPDGTRVALFRDGGSISAVTNVCAHQGGPLGEGRIIDGCVTCPWHGWQYRACDGQSPPPFTEKIATHDIELRGGRLWVRLAPNPPGTPTMPVTIGGEPHA